VVDRGRELVDEPFVDGVHLLGAVQHDLSDHPAGPLDADRLELDGPVLLPVAAVEAACLGRLPEPLRDRVPIGVDGLREVFERLDEAVRAEYPDREVDPLSVGARVELLVSAWNDYYAPVGAGWK